MRVTKPWFKSTGPRTALGKARAAQNALKGKCHDRDARALRDWLRWQCGFLRRVLAVHFPVNHHDRPRFHSRHKLVRPMPFIPHDGDIAMIYKGWHALG